MSVATALVDLETRRDEICAELATLTAQTGSGPDFSMDGVSISNDAHRMALLNELEKIQEMIARLSGPVVIRTQGC